MDDDIAARKRSHLELALRPDAEPGAADPLFRCVKLAHCALPELALADVDLSATLCGRRLRAPFLVAGMVGGTEEAGRVNRDLARVAEEEGVAFGVGSMRIALERPETLDTFRVDPARPPLLLANVGAQQLAGRPTAARRLVELLGADGLCVHLNPAQELVQPGGDSDFRGCLDAVEVCARDLGPALVVKETGCGIAPAVARALRDRGVRAIDVSGCGGTSWTAIERLRAASEAARRLGAELAGWGIPSAAAIGAASGALRGGPAVAVIGSGGVRSGLDAAAAIALGADVVAVARPLLLAHHDGGIDGARRELRAWIDALRAACLLTGSRDLGALRAAPRVVLEPLASWLAQLR
jgi:isopentenyl-diphosphate Delta-isomerase